MALLTQWSWVWVDSGSCWWTGRPGVLKFMVSQRVGHDWATELDWTEQNCNLIILSSYSLFFHFKIVSSAWGLALLTQLPLRANLWYYLLGKIRAERILDVCGNSLFLNPLMNRVTSIYFPSIYDMLPNEWSFINWILINQLITQLLIIGLSTDWIFLFPPSSDVETSPTVQWH